jgi:predicted ATPase/signal transduction histidine kinase/tRNA A-37 threonylcarbamoyl transferase component Bud32
MRPVIALGPPRAATQVQSPHQMGLPLPEYRMLRPIREATRSRVYEAVHERDGRVVIAKVFDIEGEADEDRVQREFELIRSLDVEGVVRALDLRRVGDQLVLLLERVPGENLAEFARGQALALEVFWPIATQLTEILARTHAARVVHRDIKPANILLDPDTGQVFLADFGISVLLEHERRHIYDSDVFVGTLPYISPEQTGRTSRAVDFRSDLYSLGVTFYELLTGCRPFENLAPLDLIHAHLAREAEPPITLRPELPDLLSRLVMKLMAKAPEHRYQTAAGLAVDLHQLAAAHALGKTSSFELGRADLVTTLRFPHQLYGRDHERSELLAAFERVVGSGGRETLVLMGPVGVGKSALAGELAAAVAGRGGYMVRGEVGEAGELPYAGVARTFTALFEQLLTESDARLERWRRLFVGGLGVLAAVIAELAPTFELIIGQQSPAQALEGRDARNRLLVAVERLLAVVCANGPLVLVLDDVHRAGLGAIELLEGLVASEHGPLLVVATARPEQMSAEHPLRTLLLRPDKSPRLQVLELAGISSEAVEAFVTDSLPGASDVRPLAQTIARRTNGVPLFVRQLLTQLFEHAALRPSNQGDGGDSVCGWVWDQAAVEAEPLPDDAVALMQIKLDLLSDRVREVVARAACIGVRFDLARLSSISTVGRDELRTMLVDLEDSGVLMRAGSGYRFAQDSVRTAAYASLAADTRRELHWAIGNDRLAQLGGRAPIHAGSDDREQDEQLFEIVDHLDAGAPADLAEARRLELATLDLRAGRCALAGSAHALAHRYLSNGIALVGDRSAEVGDRGPEAQAYELVFGLHFTLARVLSLAGQREQADAAFAQLLVWPLDERHYAEVVARRLELLWTEVRQPEAVDLGIEALASLGSPVPRSPGPERAKELLTRAWQRFREYDAAAVAAMPRCTDEHAAGVIDVVAQLKFSTYSIDTNLFLYLTSLHAELCGVHGYHQSLPKALSDLSFGVSGGLDQVSDSIHLQDLGCELARVEPLGTSEARLLAIGGQLTLHRGRPFADIVAQFDAGYRRALEAGEFDSAGFLGAFGADMQLDIGTHLRVLDRRCRKVDSDIGRWCPPTMRVEVWMLRGICRALLGGPTPDGDDIWELDPQQVFARRGGMGNFHNATTMKAMLALVFGDSANALQLCLDIHTNAQRSMYNSFFLARLRVLTCVAYYTERLAGRDAPAGADVIVDEDLGGLQRWAEDAPTNYGHYHDFALGLRYAYEGRMRLASEHIDRAWNNSRQRGCRWLEGLAAEQLAAQLARQGLTAPVEGVLQHAWTAYSAWGAEAKLVQLRASNPSLLGDHRRDVRRSSTSSELDDISNISSRSSPPTGSSIGRVTGLGPAVDLGRVLTSVGSISEDLRLEEVIARVLDAALTNVGADHGLLLLDRAGELALVAASDGVGQRQMFAHPPLLRTVGHLAPTALINFVARTGKSVVLDDAREDMRFAGDPYLETSEVRSILALPLQKGDRRLGVLVLENHLTTHGFGASSIEALRLITSQAASTLENAQLYTALKRSDARWRSLVDGAPDLIALLDEQGAVVFRNHAGPLRGIDETDEGDSDGGSLEAGSSVRWRDAVESVLGDGDRRELELEYLTATGDSRWYAVRIAPIEVDRGLGDEHDSQQRNAVAVATDISERKQAEVEKRELEAQLRQQQRLESVGTLASGVAHEINNPIQGIMNYAELIYSNVTDHDLVVDFAREIDLESHRVAKIVRNLLAFSRQDASEDPEPVQMIEVVESSLSLIRAVLRSDHIALEVIAEPGLPAVRCRPQQVQQVIMNLVTNARDALKSRYGEYDERKRIELRVQRSARQDWVKVSVRDFGPGIPAEVLPRIFDPFFTTKGRDQGTGLGLAVSHGIAQEHGGELTVETVPGQGATFTLELPVEGVEMAEPLY